MPSSPSSSRARLESMDEEERESAALHVRERIYVTFATLAVALTIGIVLLAATLVLVGWLGVRRTALRPLHKLLLILLLGLALVVIALKLMAGH